MKRAFRASVLFQKQLKKIKGKELKNILNKIGEILNCIDINHYKNLKYDLKKYKRVHVNDSYVILFFGDDNTVYFVDYNHHDVIYKYDKHIFEKYEKLTFE
ncbi:MAG: type II toxin-antitoxin system RelE family toxin [Candidatus Nanoarchaeia archaeon]